MKSKSYITPLIAMLVSLGAGNALLAQADRISPESEEVVTSGSPKRAVAKPIVKLATPKPNASKSPAPRAVAEAQGSAAPPSPLQPSPLPNGASTITESYGDWTVNCRADNGQKLCGVAQAQGNKEKGIRRFAIELLVPKDGKTNGTVLMPFGLKLDAGATLKLDSKDLGQTLHFSTCVPDGCLLPVSFPASIIEAMKKGTILDVTSLNLGNEQPVTFSISLTGFPAALKRVADLGS